MCIRIYIFNLKTEKQNKINITRRQKEKENKKEKRIPVENLTGYNDIVCKFALCTCNLLDQVVTFSWLFI